ncbi:MAG TPA: sulfatase-like hydrolase/transferase [Ignavibacteriaceae bacterium]|jgi:hypothetical protein
MERTQNIFSKVFPAGGQEITAHPLNIILLFLINTSTQKIKAGLPIGFTEPVFSFLIIFIASLITYFLFRRLINERIKAAMLLSYTLLITLFFRDIVEFIIYFKIPELISFTGEYLIAIIFSLILFALLIKWLASTNRRLAKLNTYLNLVTTIFLAVEIIGCSFSNVSKLKLKERIELNTSVDATEKPDIYFILLDGYTGFSGLKKLWDYDNNELKSFFTENNFFFPQNGRCVYNVTNYSMASTFNMTELIYSRDDLYSKGNYLLLAHFIKHNPAVKFLYKSGYNFYNFSFWDINDKNKFYEDIYFLRRGNIYQARTLYGHLYEIYNEKFADMAEINPEIFNRVKEIHQSSGDKPKFIYAHITMPHPPYYFDADGNRKDYAYSGDQKDKHKYLEQLKYTNKLLINTLSSILNSDKPKPVIIVQGDHGFRSYEGKDKRDIEYSVLNCFYFPDKDYSMMNDSLKTINTFRIIFNKYFNRNFELIN